MFFSPLALCAAANRYMAVYLYSDSLLQRMSTFVWLDAVVSNGFLCSTLLISRRNISVTQEIFSTADHIIQSQTLLDRSKHKVFTTRCINWFPCEPILICKP